MAYAPYSSTAPNPPVLLAQPVAFGRGSTFYGVGSSNYGGALWLYQSTHVSSDISATDFFSDGKDLGFKRGDLLIHNSLSSGVGFYRCSTVQSTYMQFSTGLFGASAT